VPQPSDFINAALADVLRGAYVKKGLNREQIAERSGISLSTIQRYMNGKVDIPSKSFQRVAEAIGRPADEMYAEALRDAERMSEAATQNEDPRSISVDELELRRRDRTLAAAATEVDPESTEDEPQEP
jgi:transcriptional regulator with XRE-family HTH domain